MSGSLFIVAAPSGAGKTSLVNALVVADEKIILSVSHTTRDRRVGEVDEKDYFFIDDASFTAMKEEKAFLESAKVFDHYYGTSRTAVLAQLKRGNDVILEIDWQGARQIKANFPDSTSIFILPPSKQALETRLRARGQDDDTVIARRMQDAENQISHYTDFDHLIVNDDFNTALGQIMAGGTARRLSIAVQKQVQATLIGTLLV